MTHGLRNSPRLLERLVFIKKFIGLISKMILVYLLFFLFLSIRHVAQLPKTETDFCKAPCTCEEQSHSCTPDMSSLRFSTEDIPTGRDRTLRTVAPAGTVHASSTGTRTDVSSREAMHIYRLFYM